MQVLVTGGGGFIGSHLVDRLIYEGHKVIVFEDWSTGNENNMNDKACYFHVDISKKRHLYKIDWNKIDVVFHLAAQINLRHSFKNPRKDAKTNIIGSLNIIEMSQRHNSKLIFASTGGAIYSPNDPIPWIEKESFADPQSPYGLSKLTVEKYLSMLHDNHCILRLSNVYGPRQNPKGEAGVISIFIDNIKNEKDLHIFGDGRQTRDFIYVSDVINAFIQAGFSDMNGIYNVSYGKSYSVNEIANCILSKMWANRSISYCKEVPGELKHSCLSNALLKQNSWKPKISLEQGIQKTIKYFTDI